jgi:hypothetical protein
MKTTVPLLVIIFSLSCFAFLSKSQAVLPPPDGGYAGGNTAEGQNALLNLGTGIYNTGLGIYSLLSLTEGEFNTAVGAGTLLSNNASENTATGAGALLSNTSGDFNTATGTFALFSNTTGEGNNAFGVQALLSNKTGSDNTATGDGALFSSTTGDQNTASGVDALFSNTTGGQNTATGISALFFNNGDQNTANGSSALGQNTTGNSNTASGAGVLASNTTGSFNTADGQFALANNITGVDNIALGSGTGSNVTTASHVIAIGSLGANVSNTCFIGNIRDVQTQNADAIPVVIDSTGQLGTASSSRRFKDDIKPIGEGSEAILALRPVTFHYASDSTNRSQFGLIAEEVASVNPDLVARDRNGDIYTVRYDQINAMLLNEFLKDHRKVQEQQHEIDSIKAELREQRALIQKVSTKIETTELAELATNNNP